jgi:two-component sensor histidine kinase
MFMKRKTSIMQRITLMSWLVAVLSVAVFALFMIHKQRLTMLKKLEEMAGMLTDTFEEDLTVAMSTKDLTAQIVSCKKLLLQNKGVVEAVVVVHQEEDGMDHGIVLYRAKDNRDPNDDGIRMADPMGLPIGWQGQGYNPSPENHRPKKPTIPGVELGEILLCSRAVVDDGNKLGEIYLGMGLASMDEQVSSVYVTAGLVGSLILIAGVLGAWIFARNITRPLLGLQSFAYKVATGALNARATVDSGDEIGDLAHSINRMVEALEGNQQKLRDSVKTEAAAREKEILLREIHHRVKNNMQILTSLLRLQSRRANSAQLRTVLQESESRIRSMALLHEKLYQSESVSTIDMNGYLRSLTNELLRVNTPAGKRREVRLNVNNINLGMDTALPSGLIVTELVSNALKYAFPDHPEGIIYVSISLEQTGEYALVVWDNGVGIPAGLDITKTESLGMRLVTMLTDQLNGTFQYANNQGTRWEIKFRESQYKIRL